MEIPPAMQSPDAAIAIRVDMAESVSLPVRKATMATTVGRFVIAKTELAVIQSLGNASVHLDTLENIVNNGVRIITLDNNANSNVIAGNTNATT